MAKTKWALDPTHSEIGFKIKHLMISNVTGNFKKFSVEAETEAEDFATAQISASLDVASIDTKNEQRDGHLRAADFFEADKHPQLVFKSTKITAQGLGTYQLTGDFTIKDITKPVTLSVEYSGIAKDPWGNVKAGFTVHGKINRKDWGINWNAPLEAGGFLLGDDLKVEGEIQLVKQAVAQPA